VDDCRAKSHVSAQAEHAGDLIGVGVHPGFWNLQKLCNPHRIEEWIKAAEPLASRSSGFTARCDRLNAPAPMCTSPGTTWQRPYDDRAIDPSK